MSVSTYPKGMRDRLIEQRLIRRFAMDILAAPLHGEAQERFLSDAEADLNKSLPAPGRQQMRKALRIID